MSDTEQRFGLTMRGVDRDEPGLVRERDGTVWLVAPDGTRTQLPGGGGGGLEPPVVITGTDPGTSPLSVQGAPAQSEALFRVDNDPGNDPRILVEAGGATTIFGEGDAGSDNSKLEVDYGLSIYDEDGTKIAVFEKGDITFTSGSVKVNGNGLPEVIRIPLTFDTPGLVITGVEVYQPAPGDLIAHAFVWVSEEWDGTTPRFYLASAGTEASTGEIMYGPFNISDPPLYNDPAHHSASVHDLVQINATGTILLDTTPVVAIVDNNATPSGDPGSTQGALELVLVIDRAA